MNNVIYLPTDNYTPDRMLDETPRDLQEMVILGYDKQGEFYFAMSGDDPTSVMWLLKLAEKFLLEEFTDEETL